MAGCMYLSAPCVFFIRKFKSASACSVHGLNGRVVEASALGGGGFGRGGSSPNIP